jgi:hypothetical protein
MSMVGSQLAHQSNVMKRIISFVGWLLVLALSQLFVAFMWDGSGRLIVLSIVLTLSLALSVTVSYQRWRLGREMRQLDEETRRIMLRERPELIDELSAGPGQGIEERHWLAHGLRQFAQELLEVIGLVAAFLALPVTISFLQRNRLPFAESFTFRHLVLGIAGLFIYAVLRYWQSRRARQQRARQL